MYLLDLAKIILRNNANLSTITNNEIATVINDQQFQNLNIKGAEIFYLFEAMKKLQSVIFADNFNITTFKDQCHDFTTRACQVSFNSENYTETDINIFSDFLYYHTIYFEFFSNIPEQTMLADIKALENKIETYDEYIENKDAVWLTVEHLKVLLIQLYNINFSILEDRNKPMEVIESVQSTIEERRSLQQQIVNDIKVEA